MANLWDHDKQVRDFDIDVPAWIDQDITAYDVAAIVQGGCASGAYMPAVTYRTALETMGAHGDDVLQYLEDRHGEIPQPIAGESWGGLACHYLSMAVDLWAASVEDELETAIDDAEGSTDD